MESEHECTSSAMCQWEADGNFCIHNDAGGDPAGLECAEKDEKAQCNSEDVCIWNAELGSCESVNEQQFRESASAGK